MKSKKTYLFLVLIVLGLFFAFILSLFWYKEKSKPVSSDNKKVDFLIIKGRGASQIAQELYSEGLIKSPLAFKIYVQSKGNASSIKAGRYSLSPNFSLAETVNILVKGPKDLWVVVPEGLRREEVVEKFISGLEKEGNEANSFRQEFLGNKESLEGFLFPDTYLFPREEKAGNVILTMRSTFDKRVKDLKKSEDVADLTLHEIVTLASLIERETKTNEERPIVAGILLNRLKIDMGLQVDASVQYGLSSKNCLSNSESVVKNINCEWWPVLSREDLSLDSLYNTYKYKGLPPAPIANPGFSSISAVYNPKKTDYVYYLHDKEGKIHYATTLDEHNENVSQYLSK